MFLSFRTCGGAGDTLALLSRTHYVSWCARLAVGAFRWVRTQVLTVSSVQLLAGRRAARIKSEETWA